MWFLKIELFLMQHLGKVLHLLIYFQEVKNEHFEKKMFSLTPCTRENNVL